MLPALDSQFADGVAGTTEVGEAHLRIFTRKQNAGSASGEGGGNGSFNALRSALAVAGLGGNVDIDTGPDESFCSGDTIERAFGFAGDVIGRESGVRNLFIVPFLDVHDRIVEIENLLLRKIVVDSGTDVIDIESFKKPRRFTS